MTKVTVVIPNYNGMKFLPDCMTALLQQDADTPSYQVIVVDNGSQDQSLAWLEQQSWQKEQRKTERQSAAEEGQPQVRVISLPENTGFCHAVNVGIKEADTPYIILLNNDTKVHSGFVKHLTAAIEQRKDCFSVSASMRMWDKPQLLDDAGDFYCVFGWAYARGKGRPAAEYEKAVEIFSACGGAAIYRKEILEEIGLFDEQHFAYLEDLDIGYRARIYGYRNFYEPKAKVIHYGSASSGSRYNAFKTSLAAANNLYVVGKNMPLLQLLWNLPFLLTGFFIKFLFFCKKGMGRLYAKGLLEGLKKLYSKEGRARKIRFQRKHLGAYFSIQWQLYYNVIQILKKN